MTPAVLSRPRPTGPTDGAQIGIGAVIGIVLMVFLVAALIGPTADQIQSAEDPDGNASTDDSNVSSSAIAILDLNPLFLAVLPLAVVAALVARAFA